MFRVGAMWASDLQAMWLALQSATGGIGDQYRFHLETARPIYIPVTRGRGLALSFKPRGYTRGGVPTQIELSMHP
ncbi:hypothetical protein F5X98DRAFT_337799 [Xylaria grammica]|nr:hypothetical protein F5X98DRAFT_337799 [Xylaria grammica]